MAFILDGFASQTHALMRIVAGAMFLWHGTQKLFGFPKEAFEGTPAFVTYVAGPIELVGGVLIAVGFMTRQVAFLCSGLMAAAYWMAHGTKHLFPLINQGELAALYCFVFLFLAANGAGPWSIDASRGESA